VLPVEEVEQRALPMAVVQKVASSTTTFKAECEWATKVEKKAP